MGYTKTIITLFVVYLTCGCAPSASRVDPLSSLNMAPVTISRSPEYKELSLALILSDNTRNTGEQLKKWNSMMRFNAAAQVDLDNVFAGLLDIFRKNFLKVETVQNVEEARKLNVDCIAVLDINMTLSNFIWNPTVVEISSILLTKGKMEIDNVRGEATKKGHGALASAFNDAQAEFQNALLSSKKLHEFSMMNSRGLPVMAAGSHHRHLCPARPGHKHRKLSIRHFLRTEGYSTTMTLQW